MSPDERQVLDKVKKELSLDAKAALGRLDESLAKIRTIFKEIWDKFREHMAGADHSGLHQHRNDITRTGMPVRRKKGMGQYQRRMEKKKK